MSVVLAPVLLQGSRCVLWKSQVMFSVLLHFFLAAVLNCEGYWGSCLGMCSSSPGCLGDAHGDPCLLDQQLHSGSRRTLKQRRDDQRAREIQNQRASGAFLCWKVNARRLLSVRRLRTAVGNGKPCSLKCARKSSCACARPTVLSSALSVQRHIFPKTFSQPKCNKWERLHQDKWFYGIWEISSLINLYKTAAASSREMGELGIKHGHEGQSAWHGHCHPGWCTCLLCSQHCYSSQPKPHHSCR